MLRLNTKDLQSSQSFTSNSKLNKNTGLSQGSPYFWALFYTLAKNKKYFLKANINSRPANTSKTGINKGFFAVFEQLKNKAKNIKIIFENVLTKSNIYGILTV